MRLSFEAGRRSASRALWASLLAGALAWAASPSVAQTVDCARLQAQIAATPQRGDGGNARVAAAARRQASELSRTQAYAHQLNCDGFTFFGANPQCGGITQRIAQMQANLQRLQASAGGAGDGGLRQDLIARYNAACANGQPKQRGFFESIFGGPDPRPPALSDVPPDAQQQQQADEDTHAHGGSQAVCVRTCDGGFFPLGVSSRRSGENLVEMCQALCPGTETAVFTRNPDSDIKSAVGLDGKPYMDLPNALKFQKAYTPACSCRPPGKTWAETLANAEQVLDNVRSGDIIVTKEKSDELSRPKLDAKSRSALIAKGTATALAPGDAARVAGDAADNDNASPPETAATDGTAHTVRRVGPRN